MSPYFAVILTVRAELWHFVDQLQLQCFPWSDCYVSVKELFECRSAIGETEKTVG